MSVLKVETDTITSISETCDTKDYYTIRQKKIICVSANPTDPNFLCLP